MSKKRNFNASNQQPTAAPTGGESEITPQTAPEAPQETSDSPEVGQDELVPKDAQEDKQEPSSEAMDNVQDRVVEDGDDAVVHEEIQEEEKDVIGEARQQFSLPESWSDEEVVRWLNVETDADKMHVAPGVFRFDPTREHRKVESWEDVELLSYLQDRLFGVEQTDNLTANVIDEYRRRARVEPAWSNNEVLAYFRDNIRPERLSSGVWINDQRRQKKNAGDWSDEEVVAWAQNEISATGRATSAQLANELNRRFNLKVRNGHPDTIRKAYLDRQKSASANANTDTTPKTQGLNRMNQTAIDSGLQRYVDAVAPGKVISEKEGFLAQQKLEDVFQYVMRLPTEDNRFLEGMNRVRDFINEHRDGVFSPSYAYRFTHGLKGTRTTATNHVNLIELFLLVTDKNKARRQQTDIPFMVQKFPDDQESKLADYFTNHN